MRRVLKACVALLICFVILLPPGGNYARAEETKLAEDISKSAVAGASRFYNDYFLFDGGFQNYAKAEGPAYFELKHEKGIGSVYISFPYNYGEFTVTNEDTGVQVLCGSNGFLHEFVDMTELFGTAPQAVTISFAFSGVCIEELCVFTEGQVPDFVEKWKLPVEGTTDLILFSTHADDEHLFFAGTLPYYAKERGYQVQVVYLTDHHNRMGNVRNREALGGLWAVGVDTYPVFGPFPDFKVSIYEVYDNFERMGYSRNDLLGYVVEQIRRFKPKVVVGHDFAGEYGHSQHMVYAEMLSEAVKISMDPSAFPESAEKYGVWDVPKTYIHLLEDNSIVMDWDQPLNSFDGQTAFEVSINRGFQAHRSQINAFRYYYDGYQKAADLPQWNPCYFGLYRSTVGPDINKNDFFENVSSHGEDAKRAEEEAARLKAEQEEAARLAEEERLRAEEAERAEQARQKAALDREAARQRNHVVILAAGSILLLSLIALVFRIKNCGK